MNESVLSVLHNAKTIKRSLTTAVYQIQHTKEIISAGKTPHKHNKELNRLW